MMTVYHLWKDARWREGKPREGGARGSRIISQHEHDNFRWGSLSAADKISDLQSISHDLSMSAVCVRLVLIEFTSRIQL